MSHVFICYNRANQNLADIAEARIRRAGIITFIDDIVNPGEDWPDRIKRALDDSFALVLICTEEAMQSHEVTYEWAYAMGQGTTIIPLVYDVNCHLHSRLAVLQYIDLTDQSKGAWDKLIRLLINAKNEHKATIRLLKQAGIHSIMFSREELDAEYHIGPVLRSLKPHTELVIIARSCEAWAREYTELQSAINNKSIRIRIATVDPKLPREQWMIEDDYAQFDLRATLDKLKRIDILPESKGCIELYWLPSSTLFSFVHYVDENGTRIGVLEAGASLSLSDRTCLIFRSDNPAEGIMLSRLCVIYDQLLTRPRLCYLSTANGDYTFNHGEPTAPT